MIEMIVIILIALMMIITLTAIMIGLAVIVGALNEAYEEIGHEH